MTTPAIPAHDAEKLRTIVCSLDGEYGATTHQIEIGVEDAYRLGLATRPDYTAHCELALSQLDITRIGAVRDEDGWHVTATTSGGDSRNGDGTAFVEALLAAVEAIEEMRAAMALARSNAL